MKHSSTLHVSKMHGAGNDFIVLDLRDAEAPSPELCRALANRHTGIGCDMILGVNTPRSSQAAASYKIWTADGSQSQQCGNGARCIAAWVVRAGIAEGARFALDSPSGTHEVDVLDKQRFRITMCVPEFEPERIPLYGFDNKQDIYEAELDGGISVRFAAVSIGNPHAVIEVDDIDNTPVKLIGQALQNSRVFLPTVNVGFAEILSRDRIKLRVYEYGAGETLACGSGACAAAAVLMQQNRIDRSVSVALPGGDLYVNWPGNNAQIMLTGPTAFVFEGEFSYASI
jgi:diaminopimelate epimerase